MQKQTFWNILPYLPKQIFPILLPEKWGCCIIMHRSQTPYVDAFQHIEYCKRGLFCICERTVSESVLSLHVPKSKKSQSKNHFQRVES